PRNWPGWPRLTTSRSRFPGVLVMGVIFLAMLVWWRGCQPHMSSPARRHQSESATEVQPHGGEVVATLRAEPRSFNRLVSSDQTTEAVAMLMQGRLVRINRSTFELEPWLRAPRGA